MQSHCILQWNCNGFYSKINEIKLLINKLNPYVLCIQETLLKGHHVPKLKNYNIYNKNFINPRRASQGVAILVNNQFKSGEISINSDIQAVACTIYHSQYIPTAKFNAFKTRNYKSAKADSKANADLRRLQCTQPLMGIKPNRQ